MSSRSDFHSTRMEDRGTYGAQIPFEALVPTLQGSQLVKSALRVYPALLLAISVSGLDFSSYTDE